MTTVLLLATAACGSSTDANSGLDGLYNLETVNGLSLPFTAISQQDGSKNVLQAEALTLTARGTFTRSRRGQRQLDGQFGQFSPYSFSDSGTFTRAGSDVQFQFFQTRESPSGTVAGGRLMISFADGVRAYRKAN